MRNTQYRLEKFKIIYSNFKKFKISYDFNEIFFSFLRFLKGKNVKVQPLTNNFKATNNRWLSVPKLYARKLQKTI
jgi:hypothetical protein